MTKFSIRFITLVLLCFFALSGCGSTNNAQSESSPTSTTDESQPEAITSVKTDTKTYSDNSHKNSSVEIKYPQLQGESESFAAINKHIADTVKSFADAVYGDDYENLELKLDYKILYSEKDLLSVTFEGLGNVTSAAHPNNWFFALSYNLATGKQIRPIESVSVDSDFIKALREAVKSDSYKEEWLNGLDDDALYSLLKDSDVLFKGNYSFYTKDAFGISLEVPHALGDHIELLIPYSSLSFKDKGN